MGGIEDVIKTEMLKLLYYWTRSPWMMHRLFGNQVLVSESYEETSSRGSSHYPFSYDLGWRRIWKQWQWRVYVTPALIKNQWMDKVDKVDGLDHVKDCSPRHWVAWNMWNKAQCCYLIIKQWMTGIRIQGRHGNLSRCIRSITCKTTKL